MRIEGLLAETEGLFIGSHYLFPKAFASNGSIEVFYNQTYH